VKVPLTVSAGDKISATVSVSGTSVTVKLGNLTTGKSFAKTLRMASPEISSAEWVAEAPSALTPGGARILLLTDFGTVRFTRATATSTNGHTGPISDSDWTATRISLVSGGGGPGPFGPFAAVTSGTQAVPGSLSAGGSAFSITWGQTAAA
jgi:Peptidase A4 family